MADPDAGRPAAAPTADTAPPALDNAFYTWSNFFSILTGKASDETARGYYRARDDLYEKSDCERCDANTRWLFKHSPVVRFMQQNIDMLGPADGAARIHEGNVRCRRCDTEPTQQAAGGGFDADHGILLCANKMRNRGHQEDTLAHEMVHAYDHMRFKLDPYDLRHAACMEIRASTLSGECRWSREFFIRGQWNLTQQLQECVRRRAVLSVRARPACKDDLQAVRVVNEVWDSCFNDTRPFDEIYR